MQIAAQRSGIRLFRVRAWRIEMDDFGMFRDGPGNLNATTLET